MLSTLSVSEFISQVNDVIVGEYLVEGEVSQYKISQGKWVFFDLKDSGGVLGCFSTVFMMSQPLTDGMKVRVLGYPKIYEKTGKFSFTVQKIELVGEGSLKKAFLLLKEKLEKEGLFALERKRPLPEISERLGIIASRDSAAWGDFKRILSNRWGGIELVLRHVNVQGVEAVADVVKAFEDFKDYPNHLDAIVVIRGGGSLEDLAAFNDETVVRAIYGSRVPVVTGIGHERDDTLSDYAADVRASTPSNAAEILVPDRSEIITKLDQEDEFMVSTIEHQLALFQQTIEQDALRLSAAYRSALAPFESTIEAFERIPLVLNRQLDRSKTFIRQTEILLSNVDPSRLLKRGYSIVRNKKGKIVCKTLEVVGGDQITIQVSDGTISGTVS
jgi:exodeoxyribonuclease VII large subunit